MCNKRLANYLNGQQKIQRGVASHLDKWYVSLAIRFECLEGQVNLGKDFNVQQKTCVCSDGLECVANDLPVQRKTLMCGSVFGFPFKFFDFRGSMLNVQCSSFGSRLQRSIFDSRFTIFEFQRSMLDVRLSIIDFQFPILRFLFSASNFNVQQPT